MLNLLSNAVKFTPPDGTINLRSHNVDSRIVIEVADDGVGIGPELLPRLFNAFEQGEQTITRKFGGLGLGLSIVRSLMEMHGGSITATSEGTGRGATMSIEMATISPSGPKEAPAQAAKPAGQPLHVLLVEDHNDTRRVLVKLLASFGCSVTATASVKEALRVAELEKFDLLVSDIGLPDGSGVEVMRHMRERYNVRGIALSGFGQDEDVQRSRDAGFETHLTKPINLQTLKEVIRKLAG